MAVLRKLCRTGDSEVVEWDPKIADSILKAMPAFEELRPNHALVDVSDPQQTKALKPADDLRKFILDADEVVAVPQLAGG